MIHVNKNIIYNVGKDITNNVTKGGNEGGNFSETKSSKIRCRADSADVDEREVQAVINRGGRAAEADNGESDALRRVQLRLYTSQIADIDNAIEKLKRDRKRFPNFSRHQFLPRSNRGEVGPRTLKKV